MDAPTRINLGYSLKNIPMPTAKEYRKRLIEKVEIVIKKMRWKAIFAKGDLKAPERNTFGFKTKNCPPQVEELKAFEEDLYKMIENVSFRATTNDLQAKMKKDLQRISNSLLCYDVMPYNFSSTVYACTHIFEGLLCRLQIESCQFFYFVYSNQ